MTHALFDSIETIRAGLAAQNYFAGDALCVALRLAHTMGKPLLLEGAPGVGKTSIAQSLAGALDTPLERLQCFEGLDVHNSLYEWNHAKQILRIRMSEVEHPDVESLEADIFSEPFLLERPLLRALRSPGESVLLIDEVDRADEEFEAFLLEFLGEYQISIPELGVVKATQRPLVVLTSNNSRELSDALRRRCLYVWIDLPTPELEREIVQHHVAGLAEALTDKVIDLVGRVRALPLDRPPGVAETIDWAMALDALAVDTVTPSTVRQTKSCLVKTKEDTQRLEDAVDAWFPSTQSGQMR